MMCQLYLEDRNSILEYTYKWYNIHKQKDTVHLNELRIYLYFFTGIGV